jgi:pyruvate dehydrogenase (quinone)
LAEKLAEWGVSVVFGLPGDKNAHIIDALRRRQNKIRFVMKKSLLLWLAVTKYTGKLGVCGNTAVPGAVRLLNGLCDAKFDGAPVMAITGAPPRALLSSAYEFTRYPKTLTGQFLLRCCFVPAYLQARENLGMFLPSRK